MQRVGLRAAINAKFKDCIYDPTSGGGTWREQVAQCSCRSCPLWPLRPAPSGGPYANPPRDPAAVTSEWLRKPVGWAFLGSPCGELDQPALPHRGMAESRQNA
jgi:hypothetical protein